MQRPQDYRPEETFGQDDDGFFRVEQVKTLSAHQAIAALMAQVAELRGLNDQLRARVAASYDQSSEPVSIIRTTGAPDILVHRAIDGKIQGAVFLSDKSGTAT